MKIIFFLSSVIRNRLLQIKCTFEAFIHMKKAFDSINSNLSYYKLLLNSIINGCYYAIRIFMAILCQQCWSTVNYLTCL